MESKRLVHIVSDLGLISETFIAETAIILNKLNLEYTMIYQANHDQSTVCDFKKLQIDFAILNRWYDKLRYRFAASTKRWDLLIANAYHALVIELKRIKPDVVYVDYGRNAVLVLNAAKALDIPLIIHLHGADITSQLQEKTYNRRLLEAFEYSAKVIVASNHIKRLAILAGCASDKIEVIRLAISFGRNTQPKMPAKTDYPSLIYLGRLTAKKHPIAILHMFRKVLQKVPNAHLTIIGDGELRGDLLAKIDSLGLNDHITYMGALMNNKAMDVMAEKWIYVQHSVTGPNGDQEGFGISLAEAAVLELPVVSTIHNGIPEQVIHGETGFLVREFDFEEMAEYVIKLIDNKKLRSDFGKSGRSNILELCDPGTRQKVLSDLIKDVI